MGADKVKTILVLPEDVTMPSDDWGTCSNVMGACLCIFDEGHDGNHFCAGEQKWTSQRVLITRRPCPTCDDD